MLNPTFTDRIGKCGGFSSQQTRPSVADLIYQTRIRCEIRTIHGRGVKLRGTTDAITPDRLHLHFAEINGERIGLPGPEVIN